MKKTLRLFCLLVVLFSVAACSDDDVAELYLVTVTVNYPEGYGENVAEGISVKITGIQNSLSQFATTDASGNVTFNVEAGQYNFAASGGTDEFAFNATSDQSIVSETAFSMDLHAVALEGGLVFKEIYYTGSRTPEDGTYYADQFHEIYNNSDSVIYIDGLCIGLLEQTGSSENVWADMSRLPLSLYVWHVPGNGTDYPLEPRTSFMIAQDGIDHQTDPDGNANSPVNLGNADWETYCGDINGGKDADAAGVPNLELMFTTTTSMYDWLHSVFGRAVIIFRLPEGTDYLEWASNPDNLSTRPNSTSTKKYLMIPKEYVIDAVENVRFEEEQRYKRLPVELDAGKVWCEGTYISKSVRRKVKQIIDGKVIYKDTNNSTEDFLGNQTPTPFIHPTVVDN